MTERDRYWTYFVQTYGHSRYLYKYLEKCEGIDRRISMFSAIASSSSIGGWVIWKEIGWVWGTIIAISQVITAIKNFLPYARRADLLRTLTISYARLVTRVEGEWYPVSSGSLPDKKINDLLLKFKTEQDAIEEKLFSKVTLPTEKNLLLQAGEDTKSYFKRHYG